MIPNGQLFGYLVMAGELARRGPDRGRPALTRWSRLSFTGRQIVLGLIVLSGVVAIFMNINFHLAGRGLRGSCARTGEGDLDSLMP